MRPFYLKFPDEAEGRKALEAAFPNGDTGLDIIGEAWRTDLDPPVKREGWFANWIGEELPASLEAYAVDPEPAYPIRIFAGWKPEQMKLRDEAEEAKAAEILTARLEAELTISLLAEDLKK